MIYVYNVISTSYVIVDLSRLFYFLIHSENWMEWLRQPHGIHFEKYKLSENLIHVEQVFFNFNWINSHSILIQVQADNENHFFLSISRSISSSISRWCIKTFLATWLIKVSVKKSVCSHLIHCWIIYPLHK